MMNEIRELTIDDMRRGGRGHRWKHDEIKSFLRNVYERKKKKSNLSVVIGLSFEEIGEEWYEGELDSLKSSRYNTAKILRRDLREEGFATRSGSPLYSSTVSVERNTLRLELRKE